jgi:hypothetical protein
VREIRKKEVLKKGKRQCSEIKKDTDIRKKYESKGKRRDFEEEKVWREMTELEES